MDEPEPVTQSFIIKVWLEESGEPSYPAVWRGHITHVPGGERRYLTNMGDIVEFVRPYLIGMGVRFGAWDRLSGWLKTWTR